ncbi:hypothetical protein OHA72_59715 [Dactylosporangium sp. NBC_01737]|uniref:hypothetical protein n=1 Tax=Dactylosporangium sp. NBC_01737 TaxID=2975959 RepID=UPI002E1584E8|nr:hypothetical protein OHA72_59715 [Dactylosporangium sp. NBC_01737]
MAPSTDDDRPYARRDGLYISGQQAEDEGRSIVRFLASGEVVTAGVGSTDDPATLAEQVARWLAPGHRYVSAGRCEHDGDEVRFVASSSYGNVSYAGRIARDGLEMELAWHSDINGNSGSERYWFVPVQSLRDEPEAVE